MVSDAIVRHEANANVIKMTGELTGETVRQALFIFNQACNQNQDGFIFDFSDVDFVDSKGAGFLLGAKQKMSGKRRIILAAMPSQILAVLTRLMIAEQFKVCATVEEALKKM
ncbi:MAG: STAS domain-containing protein [bacterium]